jgi:hypothetical protein
MSSIGEIISMFVAGAFYHRFGLQKSLFFFFCIASAGSAAFLFYTGENALYLAALIMIIKAGTSANVIVCYVANAHTFPTLFATTSMGVGNFFARLATIGAPVVAEIEG